MFQDPEKKVPALHESPNTGAPTSGSRMSAAEARKYFGPRISRTLGIDGPTGSDVTDNDSDIGGAADHAADLDDK